MRKIKVIIEFDGDPDDDVMETVAEEILNPAWESEKIANYLILSDDSEEDNEPTK